MAWEAGFFRGVADLDHDSMLCCQRAANGKWYAKVCTSEGGTLGHEDRAPGCPLGNALAQPRQPSLLSAKR